MTDHAVLIAAVDLLPALKARLAPDVGELLTFGEAEALRALELITTRRPGLVFLERRFATTPRGAALINRIKADPSLLDTQIRVIGPDGHTEPESVLAAPAKITAARPAQAAAAAAPARPAPELDYRGTRRAPRYRIASDTEVLVDGSRGTLVDLSTLGAQLVTTTILKPNQRVRVSLTDPDRPIRSSATVVWASFEIPKGTGARYRAGLDFIEPDTGAIDAYIRRHKA
ncbi:MAG TPA: PilZ domain-containing protein [Vicinamibacterales bacterium]|nr:PilZ domain-containing protein [Vicinamibacterales bacterium]